MKIKNLTGKDVEACCSFRFRGLTISASTISSPPNSILVYNKKQEDLYEAVSIEDAIAWVVKNPRHWNM
ncbi:unnamed protein product [marine sediment metagenome]|uniref:Uncharacterized protein n=1 Tax=marine sediment metagenome TaxID=412755 RepID=X0UJT2_9ZZZZ